MSPTGGLRVTRRRALPLALAVASGLAVLAPLPARPASGAVPPAPGWEATGHSVDHGGIETFEIRRADPLGRGQVAVVPRSQLDRLRTVLASDQLVGGTGHDLPSNLCARLHCHAGINGDRWELFGHDAGRPVGAVAVGGELIATQPVPPADPYAHLLIGRDGSMDGTIAYPMPVASSVTAGETSLPVRVNRQPGVDQISVLTRRYSNETRTPPGTVEFHLSAVGGTQTERSLVPVARRDGSGPIADSSLVVAANGPDAIARAEAWWEEALALGQATYQTGLGDIRDIIGGSPLLLDGGEYAFPTGDGDGRHPRSIIGWDASRVWLVTVDGRQEGWSSGLTLVEAAQMMRWLGATDAINVDGGSSATFLDHGEVGNRPSAGRQIRVAEAIVVMPPEGQVGPPPPARALEPACPPARVPPDPFPDTQGNVHHAAISCMAWWSVTSGTADGLYAPGRPVRRDQMAAFLARMLHQAGVALPTDAPDAFPDDEGSVHEVWIDVMADLGVVAGRADGRYRPSSSVTRGQMASFITRAMPLATGAPLANTTDYFADDSGTTHERAVNRLAEAGIAGGTVDGRYREGAPVRRDQMASFLARVLSTAVDAGRAQPPG